MSINHDNHDNHDSHDSHVDKLGEALKNNNVNKIKKYASNSITVYQYVNKYKSTPFHRVAFYDTDGSTTLLLASVIGTELINDITLNTHPAGSTALSIAICKGKIDVVSNLLDLGADPNAPNKFGSTPLHYCNHHDELSIAKLLFVKGADPLITDKLGCTPIHNSYELTNPLFVEMCVSFSNNTIVCMKDDSGSYPWYRPASEYQYAIYEEKTNIRSLLVTLLVLEDGFQAFDKYFTYCKERQIKSIKLGDSIEHEALCINYRVYFDHSLVSRLLHCLNISNIS